MTGPVSALHHTHRAKERAVSSQRRLPDHRYHGEALRRSFSNRTGLDAAE